MGRSEVVRDPRCTGKVIIVHAGDALTIGAAERVFLDHGLFVIDGYSWEVDWDVLRSGLTGKRRKFKDPFGPERVEPAVAEQVSLLQKQAGLVFLSLFPNFVATEQRNSWRPMITGPEPLHFDTYPGEVPFVTSFINVATVPRRYAIGPSFADLCRTHPAEMARYYGAAGKNIDDVSYVMRTDTLKGRGLLGDGCRRHVVELAPGAIWFFNAKMVSHEVIYGEGAAGQSWVVPDCGARMQKVTMKEALR